MAASIDDHVVHPETTETLEQQIAKLGDQSIGVEADVSQVADLQRLVDAAVRSFGRVDFMVNNAGVETRTSVLESMEAQYDKVLAINLKSAFFGAQIAARQMVKQGGGGRIINITSVHEDWPRLGNTAYCLTKVPYACSPGVELARYNILLVCVGPGAVATPINLQTMDDPTGLARLNAATPLGRMRARRKSPKWSGSSAERVRATSRQPPSLRTAASCKTASVSSRVLSDGPGRDLTLICRQGPSFGLILLLHSPLDDGRPLSFFSRHKPEGCDEHP